MHASFMLKFKTNSDNFILHCLLYPYEFLMIRCRVIAQSFVCHNLEENIIYNSLAWLNLTQSTLAMDRATNNSFKSNYLKSFLLFAGIYN